MVIRLAAPPVGTAAQADLERYLTARPDDPDTRRLEAAYIAVVAARTHHDTPLSQARHRAQLEHALRDSRASRRTR